MCASVVRCRRSSSRSEPVLFFGAAGTADDLETEPETFGHPDQHVSKSRIETPTHCESACIQLGGDDFGDRHGLTLYVVREFALGAMRRYHMRYVRQATPGGRAPAAPAQHRAVI